MGGRACHRAWRTLGRIPAWYENRTQRRTFLRHPAVEPISVDDEVARIYGEIVVDLRGSGTPIPTNDVWVAACAARTGAAVLTFDAHFRNIARIDSMVIE